MAEAGQTTASPSQEAPSPEEIAGVIAELEKYRDRLVEDFTNTAKKAKLPKSMVMAQLKSHPEIVKIDASLAQLRGEAPAATPSEENAATS
ncbi:MAG: hypothetical protein AB8B99_21070 [Phormidesmis sp.]